MMCLQLVELYENGQKDFLKDIEIIQYHQNMYLEYLVLVSHVSFVTVLPTVKCCKLCNKAVKELSQYYSE